MACDCNQQLIFDQSLFRVFYCECVGMEVTMISMIVAVAQNQVIGVDNNIPWHLPLDMQYFKRTTMGKPIIMGRKTWESIGCKPLPGRFNIVITQNQDYSVEGGTVVNSIDIAIAEAESWYKEHKPSSDVKEVMVIGGAQIYEKILPITDRLYITEVDTTLAGDAYFPKFDKQLWHLISREEHKSDERHAFDFSFKVYEREHDVAPLS